MLTIQSVTSSLLKGLGPPISLLRPNRSHLLPCASVVFFFSWSFVHTDKTPAPINFLCLPPLLPTASPRGFEGQPVVVEQGFGPPHWYAMQWPCVFIGLCKKKKKEMKKEKKCRESVPLSAVYLSELIQVDVPLCLSLSLCVCVSLRHQMRLSLQPRGTWMSDVSGGEGGK